jgi:hypothetical protein
LDSSTSNDFQKDWAQCFFYYKFDQSQFMLKWGGGTSWCSIAEVDGEKIRLLVVVVVDDKNVSF